MSTANFSNLTSELANFTRPRLVSQQELYAWFTVTIVVGAIGAIFTCCLLMIMIVLNKFQTGSGIMIAHSQIVDFIICTILNIVQNATILQVQSGRFTPIDCRTVQFLQMLFVFVGNWSAVFLAANRFVAIVMPFYYKKVTTHWTLALSLLTAWAISLGCSLPMYLNFNVVLGMQPTGACGTLKITGPFFGIMGFVSTYLPIALLGVLYITLFLLQKFSRFTERYRTEPSERQRESHRRRIALAKVLFCSFLWYCLCMLPPPILINFYPDVWRREFRLLMWTRTLLMVGYAVNPHRF
ncbi:allatostatin-A receptor-like [Paramacrobiotus metropolitanus]|uniref:allatostatin-A receptor-like n=1 Tax=Paramacrobiotus metropolitanus TaxID=2943436 RepID=UPI0024458585|nr:allatostatin-A receptor-like [Paramacrobiotus metropolitanus]